jgi:hypothetical protein
MKISLIVLLIGMTAPNAGAQFTKAIEDNSFYIEEAYNQESGVVQHIPNSFHSSASGDIHATFTQEWPVGSELHQLSYTIPFSSMNSINGIGDVLINYRYQLIRSDDGLAVSPRISVSIPTGNHAQGFGDGVIGYQVNIPVSKRWTNEFVTHFNLGGTLLPGVRNPAGGATTLDSYFIGGSAIYLATLQFNFLLEALHTITKSFSPGGGTDYVGETVLSPGVRCAIDINDLQIVPGVALPFVISSTGNSNGVFLYVSFEHPF